MAHLAMVSFDQDTYQGSSNINFVSDSKSGLSVTILTERLNIRSVKATEAEYDLYAGLFGNKKVMEKYGTGETKTRDEVAKRISIWAKRWFEGDPFSGMSIFERGTNRFIGHIVVGHGDRPGQAEFGLLIHEEFWNQKYGSEAAKAIFEEYIPALIMEGYLLKGQPLDKVMATARVDNFASNRILQKITGMRFVDQIEKFGARRNLYAFECS